MLRVLFFVPSLILSVQTEWIWRVFPESGFKILSPSALIHQATDVPTPTDIIQYHQYHGGSVADTDLPMAFVIDHYTLPVQDEDTDDTYYRDFFENTIDEILTSLDGTLVYMDFSSAAGREECSWKATYQKGEGIIRGQCILAGDQYYGLQVFGWKRDKPESPMQKFLESFKLLDKTGS